MRPAPQKDLASILERSEAEFNSLKGHHVLLSGATGFFGKWLTQTFLAANDTWNLDMRLTLISRSRDRALDDSPWLRDRPDVDWIEQDIRELNTDRQFDTIIHGAAAASRDLNEKHPDIMFDTIVEGTKRVLTLGAGCKSFLFISSGAVYGPQPADVSHVPEGYLGAPDPMDSKAAYGEAKRAAEMLCASHARRHGFELKIARCFAFIGPYLPLDSHFAAGNFIRDVLQNQGLKIGGDGTPMRSYLYAADLVIWLVRILVRGKSLRPYNLGSPEEVSIAGLAKAVHEVGCQVFQARKLLHDPVAIAKLPDPTRLTEWYVPSSLRAQSELSLEVWTPLKEGIERTLRWQLAGKSK